jgi:hypothetical protein
MNSAHGRPSLPSESATGWRKADRRQPVGRAGVIIAGAA